jgi:hypothetical protein
MAHVNDGTSDPGRRVVKERAEDWVCPSCGKALRYYWVSCPVDGTRRPEKES